MKHLLSILALVLSGQIFSQGEAAFFNAVTSVDMPSLENYLANRVELCIFENQQMLSKSVASEKLGSFLQDSKVKNVEVIHQGSSKDKTSNFKVAKLTTGKGVYRLFVYFTGTLSSNTIKEIRIDKF